MSGKMAAIIQCILGEEFPDATVVGGPPIRHLTVTKDSVLAEQQGDVGANQFLGSPEDFDHNIETLLDVADLTPEETSDFWDRYAQNVTDWRRFVQN
jgi:hypothetical protein